jgi:hypothetical protein
MASNSEANVFSIHGMAYKKQTTEVCLFNPLFSFACLKEMEMNNLMIQTVSQRSA